MFFCTFNRVDPASIKSGPGLQVASRFMRCFVFTLLRLFCVSSVSFGLWRRKKNPGSQKGFRPNKSATLCKQTLWCLAFAQFTQTHQLGICWTCFLFFFSVHVPSDKHGNDSERYYNMFIENLSWQRGSSGTEKGGGDIGPEGLLWWNVTEESSWSKQCNKQAMSYKPKKITKCQS